MGRRRTARDLAPENTTIEAGQIRQGLTRARRVFAADSPAT
jgi:hypothetical protein